MTRKIVKGLLAFGAVAAVGAGMALTGAGASPSIDPQRPTVLHGPAVAPAVFRHSVKSLPQLGQGNKRELQKPLAWERELEPSFGKTPPAGSVQPSAPTTEPNAPAPAPGTGGDPFAGTFAGLDMATWGAGWPPDTNGDVGPAYFIQAVNTSIGIFRKTDGARVAAYTFNSLWSGAGTGTLCDTSHRGDPTVTYDPIGDHWFVADFAFSGGGTSPPYFECIAVSRTGDPVSGGWYLYAIRADDTAHPWFPDYPKMGIWPDGLYMTANMFEGASTFREVRGWAFNRTDLESGAPVRTVVADTNTATYFSMLPSNMRTAAGAPPAGRPNLFVSESQSIWGLEVFKFHTDFSGSGSTFTGPTSVPHVTYTVAAPTVPSPGNSLDSLAERLMNSAQYTNIGGVESLWVNHTVHCCGSSTGSAGIHWLQVNVTGGTVGTTPVQQQVYPGTDDGLNRWMGSLAVDQKGDMALGYSVSSASLNPDIRYAGRFAADPAGTLPQTETTMLQGITRGSQSGNCGSGLCQRWGDYSAMTLDPDGCDFWYTQEYYAAPGLNWQTRIGSFRLNPNCGTTGGQSQTISFAPLPSRTYGDSDFTVSATASSGLQVSFSATDNCTVSGNTVHLTGAGSCTITASQAGNATYAAAPDVSQTFTIAKANQTTSFGSLANKTYGDSDFAVSATASSGLPVSFGAAGNCSVFGNTVHLTGAGSCTITASQAGNANYKPAADVPQTFSIAQTTQTISFAALGPKTYGDADFTVSAIASSGLPVTFGAAGNCTVSGNTAHLTGAGSCTITASQAGDANYQAAADVPQSFTIAQASQTISFGSLPDKTVGDPDFTVSATASSGLAVSFAAAGNCTASGNTVHLTSAGSCTITASQGGDANYQAASDVPQSFTINSSAGTHLTMTGAMESQIHFGSGAWVNGGYAFKLTKTNTTAVTVQVSGNLLLPVRCSVGGQVAGTISVPVSLGSITIPARSTSWFRTNDQKSILGWMGAVQATALCGPGAQMYNTEGATLDANVVSSTHIGLLSFEFHYRVPAAKAKPNTDCTNAADPNHNTACQAQWSHAKSI